MDTKPKTLAKKAAIYVDIDDDLTTIVGKIRGSSANIIALVPPKRTGLLQSAVNLKLLARSAKSTGKKLVIITSDHALAVLAAGAKIPTAHSLTGEPKLTEVPHLDDKDQIIEGESSGPRVVKKASDPDDDKEISAAVKALADDDKIKEDGVEEPKDKKKIKIPNFKKFQKWIIIGAAAFVALVVTVILLIINTSATITITAKTSDEKIDQAITIAKDSGATNVKDFKVKAVQLDPVKKLNEIEFTATGRKEIGEKAKGKISISNAYDSTSRTLTAGTMVFAGGMRYTLDADTYIAGAGVSAGAAVAGPATDAAVTADAIGSEYNISANAGITIAGDGANLTAKNTTAFSGGSKENITVVQQSDIDKITEKLKSDTTNNNMKADLEGRFDKDVRPIPESFEINFGSITSAPAVGERADKAKASIEITYSMLGVKNNDINDVLMAAATNKLGSNSGQGVFDSGYSGVQIFSFQLTSTGGTARLVTTAKIGPAIDDEKLKSEATGKKQNEVKQMIEKIPGVEKVEVSYFPFWVSSAPEGKITIEKNGF